MVAGAAAYILSSTHGADDPAYYRHWRPYLQDLGECEVKHGFRLNIFNLCKDNLGNTARPEKLKRGKRWKQNVDTRVRVTRPFNFPIWTLASLFLVGKLLVATAFA